MNPADPFSDSRLLHKRALKHVQEFNSAVQDLWVYSNRQVGDDIWSHRIGLKFEELPSLKPVVGDIANNFRHALEHLSWVAAQAVLSEEEMPPRNAIKFPFPDATGSITAELDRQRQYLGPFAAAVEQVWQVHQSFEYYFRFVREISNASKHRKLEVVTANASAVQLMRHGKGIGLEDIPADHFAESDVFEWEGPSASQCLFIPKLQFGDFQPRPDTIPEQAVPDAVFNCTARYVSDMIEAFAQTEV